MDAAEGADLGVIARDIVPPTRGRGVSDDHYRQVRNAELAKDKREYEQRIHDIEEGRVTIIKWGGQ